MYIRRSMGDHGFVIRGGWTDRCEKWLRRVGFKTPTCTPAGKGKGKGKAKGKGKSKAK